MFFNISDLVLRARSQVIETPWSICGRESGRMAYQKRSIPPLVGLSRWVLCIGLSLGVLIGSSRLAFSNGLSACSSDNFLDPESGGSCRSS